MSILSSPRASHPARHPGGITLHPGHRARPARGLVPYTRNEAWSAHTEHRA